MLVACSNQKITNKELMVDLNQSLIEVVEKGDYKAAKKFLEQGADINQTDEAGRTHIMAATYRNDAPMVEFLIEQKADINKQDDMQNNPFLYAGAEGYNEILRLLIKAGADTKLVNRYGGTALIPAAERGHTETVKLLLEQTDINVNHVNRLGWTALLEAIVLSDGGKEHQEIIKLLIKHDADVNLPDNEGKTPLDLAREKGFREVENILLDAGAQIS